MITEFFITLSATIADWFMGLFPEWNVPPEVAGFDNTVNGFIDDFSGLGVWAPWPLLISIAGIAIIAFTIQLTVKAARWLIGLIPTMGGGT